jgi:signal transduction histidine kinase
MDPAALTGLYLFAILPVAIGWGFWPAGGAALASYLTFEFFFVPPIHSFAIADGSAGAALVIAVATAYVVSELARRAHVRAQEARARAHDAEEAQASQRRLADEQAALRRVATLVAQGRPTSEIFEAVTREVGLLCDADLARMERFETDGAVTAIAAWARDHRAQLAVRTRFALEGASIAAQVRDTGRPARVDSFVGATGPIAREAQALGIRASVGCPITVDGHLWGVIAASKTRAEPFPADTESRIGDFTALVATAVSNAEARADLVASRERLLTAGDEARRRVVRDLHDVLGLHVPVDVSVPEDRFASEIESSAYFVVAEALTNTAKHSDAQHANVAARVENGTLRIDVSDDGIGGARPHGSGLLGLRDRVVTLGGDLEIDSPPGGGTRIAVTLPLRR